MWLDSEPWYNRLPKRGLYYLIHDRPAILALLFQQRTHVTSDLRGQEEIAVFGRDSPSHTSDSVAPQSRSGPFFRRACLVR